MLEVHRRYICEVQLLDITQGQVAISPRDLIGHGVTAAGGTDRVVAVLSMQRHQIDSPATINDCVAVTSLDYIVTRATINPIHPGPGMNDAAIG
ncbi:hypothetical protein D3C84_479840 [compost metagenome]